MSGATPLPGVSILVRTGDTVRTATSTDPDGTYHLGLAAGAYEVTAELMGFTRLARSISIGAAPCDQTIDFQLALAPRESTPAAATSSGSSAAPAPGGRGAQAQPGARTPPSNGAGAQRFETLTVQTQAAAAAGVDSTETGETAARLLLPPGFSAEGPTEALAINGNMASLDRGMMNDRLEAIGRGDFNPTTGEFGQGFGPGGQGFGGGPGGQGFGGLGGRGGPDGHNQSRG